MFFIISYTTSLSKFTKSYTNIFRKPSSNREIFIILFENKIIDNNMKTNLCNMAGLRNILVHDYVNLDREVVYDIIKNYIKDIENFRDIVMNYI